MSIRNIEQAEFDSEVLSSEKPVLVDFYADWCGPCKRLAPLLEGLADEYSESVSVVKINVDNNRDLAMEHGIRSIPTLMGFSGGETVLREGGFAGRADVEALFIKLTE
jgi:thioredoxin 1